MKAGGNYSCSVILTVDYGTWSPTLGRARGARVWRGSGSSAWRAALRERPLPRPEKASLLIWGAIRATAAQGGRSHAQEGAELPPRRFL